MATKLFAIMERVRICGGGGVDVVDDDDDNAVDVSDALAVVLLLLLLLETTTCSFKRRGCCCCRTGTDSDNIRSLLDTLFMFINVTFIHSFVRSFVTLVFTSAIS